MMKKTRNPVEFVCPEIWEFIFDKVYHFQDGNYERKQSLSRSDIQNCSQVCVTFRNILHPIRTTWLFREILPLVFHYLSGNSVQACRVVCKTWKLSTDDLLENNHDYLNILFEKGFLLPLPSHSPNLKCSNDECELLRGTRSWRKIVIESTIHLHSSVQISRFLETFSDHPSNPFPGRSLHILCITKFSHSGSNEEYEKFWKVDVIQLLCRFGDQIHSLHLEVNGTRSSIPNLLRIIFECLGLTPNLRRLRIDGWFLSCNQRLPTHPLSSDKLSLNSLPKLPYLECVQFEIPDGGTPRWSFTNPPLSLQHAILMPYSSQLQRLQLNLMGIVELPSSFITIPNTAEELSLKLNSSSHFSLLFSPDSTHPHLQRITIEISDGDHDLGDYLCVLQRFKESLRVFRFFVYPYNRWQMSTRDLAMLRELDHLEYLHLEGFKFGHVKIVKCLPRSLKYLQLDYKEKFCYRERHRCNWTDELGPGVSVDLGDELAIYSSGMWSRTPRLRWISVAYCTFPVRIYVYRRESWEMYLKEKWKWRKRALAFHARRVRKRCRDVVRWLLRVLLESPCIDLIYSCPCCERWS